MKLCWDNIENIKITKNGNFRNIVKKKTYYLKTCKTCNEEFIGCRITQEYCCIGCTNKDRFFTLSHLKNMSKGMKGKLIGDKNPNWKGGYHTNHIPAYDIYAHQIEWRMEVKRSSIDRNILEVRCIYCGKWYIPKISEVHGMIFGELGLYCSEGCKEECPIYQQRKWPKSFKPSTSREVQPQLRQMVIERDEYKCIKCGNIENLHCHHITGIVLNPIESADVDNCITLCKSCHKDVHKKDGCKYNQLKCK
jgi:hypothetical protein